MKKSKMKKKLEDMSLRIDWHENSHRRYEDSIWGEFHLKELSGVIVDVEGIYMKVQDISGKVWRLNKNFISQLKELSACEGCLIAVRERRAAPDSRRVNRYAEVECPDREPETFVSWG